MLFEYSPEESTFLAKVRKFVTTEVLPFTREWEANTAFPDEIWPKLGQVGLLNMALPKTLGGSGMSCVGYTEACRELAKGDPALSMNVAAINAL